MGKFEFWVLFVLAITSVIDSVITILEYYG